MSARWDDDYEHPRPWINVNARALAAAGRAAAAADRDGAILARMSTPTPNPPVNAPSATQSAPKRLLGWLHTAEHAVSRAHALAVTAVALASEGVALGLLHGAALQWTQAGVALLASVGITAGPRPRQP
jgi:hypothetical protein